MVDTILMQSPPSSHPSINSCTHLPIHPSIHLSIHPHIHPSIHTSTHPLIHSPIHPNLHPRVHSPIYPISPHIHSSLYSSINPSIHRPIHPFLHPSTYPPSQPASHPFTHPPDHPNLHPHAPSPIHPFTQTFTHLSIYCPSLIYSSIPEGPSQHLVHLRAHVLYGERHHELLVSSCFFALMEGSYTLVNPPYESYLQTNSQARSFHPLGWHQVHRLYLAQSRGWPWAWP